MSVAQVFGTLAGRAGILDKLVRAYEKQSAHLPAPALPERFSNVYYPISACCGEGFLLVVSLEEPKAPDLKLPGWHTCIHFRRTWHWAGCFVGSELLCLADSMPAMCTISSLPETDCACPCDEERKQKER